jgi:hypothetical protein
LKKWVVFWCGTAAVTIGIQIRRPNKPIPRHNEIKENLAKSIIKELSDK